MSEIDRTEQLIMKNNDNAFGLEGHMDRDIRKLLSKDSDIDWSKAPEGASHFCNGDWFKKEDGKWCYWFDGARSWTEAAYADPSNFSWWGARIERPTTPQWSGEGLPPVGTVCEVLNSELSDPEWEKCTILFSGNHRVLYDSQSCCERVGYIENLQFRPIRTPEQIAADEREAVVTYMQCIIGGCFDSQSIASPHEISEKLYEAGLRLIK